MLEICNRSRTINALVVAFLHSMVYCPLLDSCRPVERSSVASRSFFGQLFWLVAFRFISSLHLFSMSFDCLGNRRFWILFNILFVKDAAMNSLELIKRLTYCLVLTCFDFLLAHLESI